MKKLIKLLSLVMMLVFVLMPFAACKKSEDKLIIGITIYAPMNYYDENDKLIGFDTEYAEAVCKILGVEPKFQVIDWKTKEAELKAGNIDAIWNGLTVSEERKADMDFSVPYLTNKQCVVINKANAEKFTSAESLKDAYLTAEKGSAGQTAIESDSFLKNAKFSAADDQQTALFEVVAGNADAAVVDITLASTGCGKGSYKDLIMVEEIELANEQYAIGFKVGSELTEKVNNATKQLIEDGTLAKIAEKYGLTERYLEALQANK